MPGFPKEIFCEPSFAERFLCCVCFLVLRNAVQSTCGHRYCDNCIKEKLKNGSVSERRCPACPPHSTEGLFTEINADFAARKEIKAGTVKCVNEGCTWKGHLQEYTQEHEGSCTFERIKCLKSGCGKNLKRGDLTYHLEKECPMRVVECRHCKKQYPYKESKKHSVECPDVPTPCTSCNKRVSKSQMEKHLNPDTGDCIKRKTKCIFHPLGCTAKVVASNMEEHIARSTMEHNQLIVNALNQQAQMKDSHGGMSALCNGNELGNLATPMGELKLAVERTRGAKTQKGFASPDDMIPLVLQLEKCNKDLKGQIKDVEKKILNWEKSAKEREDETRALMAVLDKRSETYQQVLAVLSNELEAVHSKVTPLEKQNKYLKEKLEKQEKNLASQDQMLALKNIALAEQELRIQALETTSHDGALLWRIGDVRRRKQDATSGRTTSFYSPVFYTSRHGYKLAARIYLNGDGIGKGTNVSLFFVVMRGRHDSLLEWPFQQKVTFMLLEQNPSKNHIMDAFRPDPTSSSFKKPTTDMNIASGCPLFVSQEMLEATDSYIKNDTLFIKVVVDTTGLEKL